MGAGGRKKVGARRGNGLPPAEKEPDSRIIVIKEYQDELAELGLSETLGRQILEALMGIMYGFVELGVSLDLCGPFVEESSETAQAQDPDVTCEHPDDPDTPDSPAGDEDAP